MCGIAGAISQSPDKSLPSTVGSLTQHLQHRGPDGCGFWSSETGFAQAADQLPAASRIVLGHRRLSIVDLAGGGQPLANETGSVWVSYNGEIYNAPELRAQLAARGHVFRTESDTEVLVHGWEEWSDGLFGRLNGIFAFALHDTRDGVTRLVRDPIGVKPLYLGVSGRTTWWASEIQAAVACGLVGEDWDANALKQYFLFRFVPSPLTIFRDVWKIPPGHFVELSPLVAGQRPSFRRYESFVASDAQPTSADEWEEALMWELEASVTRQLMADVPVGSLLSGGVDSSLVTALMTRHVSTPPQAFSVGFKSHGRDAETLVAQFAAAQIGVPLRDRLLEDDAYIAEWQPALSGMSEPIGNASSLLLGHACRLAAGTHKVVLTGQGADEPLGGYPRHAAERLYEWGRHAPLASGLLAQRLIGSDAGRRLRRALRQRDMPARFATILNVVPPGTVDRLVPQGEPAEELARAVVDMWLPSDPERDPVNAFLQVDARTSLADDLLLVADHFSMAASVELRVPFLDLKLFELMSRMPSRYKLSRLGRRKWLYRRGALKRLPPALSRELGTIRHSVGRKVGFATPVERWFAADSVLIPQKTWHEKLASLPQIDRSSALALLADGAVEGSRLRNVLFTLTQWARRD